MATDVITIDGPTSSGKNSVGFLLAQKLGYQYIDSGMIYRAGALKMLSGGITLDEKPKILEVFRSLDVQFKMNSGWKMFLDGEDVTDSLHTPEISQLTSKVSAIWDVRKIMKVLQRKIADNGQIVMSGRDVGSEIFPDSKFKFFLTADVEVRANRRFKQLQKKDPETNYTAVLEDMIERDKRDSEREASPMRVPKDAVVIDNSKLSVEQTVEEILKYIHAQS